MIDIKFTPDGDIDLSSGDIAYIESMAQHQADLIVAQKGHIKEHPAVGVGAINYLHDESPENFLRAARKEFTRDGMTVSVLKIEGAGLRVEAKYKDK